MISLTTRRLAIIVAIIYIIKNHKRFREIKKIFDHKKITYFFLSLIAVFCISIFHYLMRGENIDIAVTYSDPWYFLYIVLYVLVFSIYCAIKFKSFKNFAYVLVGIMLFQTCIVLIGVIDTDFRMYIYEHFCNSGDGRFDETVKNGTRFIGIGLAGAAGSVCMSTGALVLIILNFLDRIKAISFWFLYVLIIIGTAFVGRTGILVELAFLLSLFLRRKNWLKNIIYVTSFAALGISIVVSLLSTLDPIISDMLWSWMTQSFSAEERAVVNEGVLQGGVPPFTLEFIFGTGLSTGYRADGVLYTSDSGLIRNYIAYGVLGFLCYYFAMYNLLVAPKRKELNKCVYRFFIICIVIAFVIEYKEPFMIKYIFPWTILTSMLLLLKDKQYISFK